MVELTPESFQPSCVLARIFTPVGLKSNRGNFYLFEPYRDDAARDGTVVFSVNLGWSGRRFEPSRAETDPPGYILRISMILRTFGRD
jgi:hypothetical protein